MGRLHKDKLHEAIQYLDHWLKMNFEHSRIPGLQVAIQHGDDLLLSRAYGAATIETNKKLTTKHLFRIASHSKTFTATALMQLVEAGKLNLDLPLSTYLDWFQSSEDERVKAVTARQLLNHTSGLIRDGEASDFWQVQRDFPDENELRSYIATAKLVYDADTIFKYSNYGFGFLGMLIEELSGQPYTDYMIEHVIKPAGLKTTYPDLKGAPADKLATGYGFQLFRRSNKPYPRVATHALASATGFTSTAEDLCRYFSAHFIGNTALLSDASKRIMQHGYWNTNDDESSNTYGLGMEHFPFRGWSLYGHGGGFPGFTTNTQFDANKKIVVSVLANSLGAAPAHIVRQIISIIDFFQQDTSAVKLPIKTVSQFTGTFYSNWGPSNIVAVGKKLFLVPALGWSDFSKAEELEVVDEHTLRTIRAGGFSAQGELLYYEFNKDGSVKALLDSGAPCYSYEEAVKLGWF